MALLCKHQVVGHTNGDGLWEEHRVREEGIDRSKTTNVQVDINAPVVIEDKVANGVCTLNWVAVVVKCIEEPRIVFSNKFARDSVCPEHISTVRW